MGGVPVVTRSDGLEMSSRVTTSANIILDIPDLNAQNGIPDYINIAIKLATYKKFYNNIRNKLIKTCLQQDDMHPFWDMYLYDDDFYHINVIDDYDNELTNNFFVEL